MWLRISSTRNFSLSVNIPQLNWEMKIQQWCLAKIKINPTIKRWTREIAKIHESVTTTTTTKNTHYAIHNFFTLWVICIELKISKMQKSTLQNNGWFCWSKNSYVPLLNERVTVIDNLICTNPFKYILWKLSLWLPLNLQSNWQQDNYGWIKFHCKSHWRSLTMS